MYWNAIICDLAKENTGGVIISVINSYRKQGNPIIEEVMD